ncbi:MAG: T9SS type A sorting domain-containing protein [bacterium]|nr:T9SS type A sorting domain-containing protein [bacterium]
MKIIIIIVFTLTVSLLQNNNFVFSQNSTTWQKVFEGPIGGDDGFEAVVSDDFGNSYLLGYARLPATTGFWIVKVNPFGDTIWTKIIGGYGTGQGAVTGVVTSDGGIIFAGERDTTCTIRLSANCDVIWNIKYPISQSFQPSHISNIIKTSDNGYIMCGRIFAQTKGCIYKIDSMGNLQWQKFHSAKFQKRYNKVIEIEGGYLIDGQANVGQGIINTVLIKLDYVGEIVWEREFRPFMYGFFPETIIQVNNSYWIFGTKLSGLVFLKFDTIGNIIDTVSINSPIKKSDSFRDAFKIHNNCFIVTSLRWGPTTNDTDYAEVKKIDSLGNILASRLITGYEYTDMMHSNKTTNGDIIIAGLMYYWQRGTNANGYAVRMDSNLNYPPVSIQNLSSPIEKNYYLYQNYPNPFNPKTVISFLIENKSNVELLIYNTKGELITKLLNKSFNQGKYSIHWDATSLPTGTYFITLLAEKKFIKTIKTILLK